MNRELVITKDGSHTLFVPELNEHYHSINGAVAESLHVFIQAGLATFVNKKTEINVLEIGFGTGLNAALTETFAKNHQLSIHYTGIEAFPLPDNIIENLNYSTNENIDNEFFSKIHQLAWNCDFQKVGDTFFLRKNHILLENYLPDENSYDLIYFDAFAPDIQPILWQKPIFDKLFKCLKQDGILVTYSAKGEVRRNLQAAGFAIERLAGAAGKREMLRGTKRLSTNLHEFNTKKEVWR